MVDLDSGEAVLKSHVFAKMRGNICDLAKAVGVHVSGLETWATRASVRLSPDILEKLAPLVAGMSTRYDPASDKLYKLQQEPKPMVTPERFDPRSSPFAYENMLKAARPQLPPPQPPQPPARRPGWK
jgi:hypothetical protein